MTAFVNPRHEQEAQTLIHEFTAIHDEATVRQVYTESLNATAGAKFSDFVPVFARRAAKERLQAMAQNSGAVQKTAPEVLFVCVHNAGRSQMAAVLTSHLSGGKVNVRSSGSAPGSDINRTVADAVSELGLDISQEFPKPLTDEVVRAADVVITMGCGDTCPVYPGKRYLDWTVDDPAGQPIEVVRQIRDDIAARVKGLLADMGIIPASR